MMEEDDNVKIVEGELDEATTTTTAEPSSSEPVPFIKETTPPCAPIVDLKGIITQPEENSTQQHFKEPIISAESPPSTVSHAISDEIISSFEELNLKTDYKPQQTESCFMPTTTTATTNPATTTPQPLSQSQSDNSSGYRKTLAPSADAKQHPDPHIPCYLPAVTAAPTFPGYPQPVLASTDNYNVSSPSPALTQQSTNPYRAVAGLSTHFSATPPVLAHNIFTPAPLPPTASAATTQQPHHQQALPQNYSYSASPHIQQQPQFPPREQQPQPCGGDHSHQHHHHHHRGQECGGEAFLEIPTDFSTASYGSEQQFAHSTYRSNDGFLGWVSNVGNKVIEKTKSSVETMITTLDPGMKAVIYSGGDVDVIITTTNDEVVSGVRQAFQEVFGKATVNGVESRSDIAVQPVGFMSGLNGAGNKIMNLRNSGSVHERQTLVSYEGFIHEIFTDQWYFIGCLTLKDPLRNVDVSTFTQAIPLNPAFVQLAQEFTPTDYDLRWSGLAVSVGETINRSLPHVHPTFWHRDIAGVTLRTMVYQAAIALATLYKNNSNFHHFHHHH